MAPETPTLVLPFVHTPLAHTIETVSYMARVDALELPQHMLFVHYSIHYMNDNIDRVYWNVDDIAFRDGDIKHHIVMGKE
jgi:hypothetical protein